jgi:hypothetical protein
VYLGAGCGSPNSTLAVNGVPSAGNAGFALNMTSAPNTYVLLAYSAASGNTPLAAGCNAYIDLGAYDVAGLYLTDGAGNASLALPIPSGLSPTSLTFQGAPFVPNPPVLGLVSLTNGLTLRLAATGCQ